MTPKPFPQTAPLHPSAMPQGDPQTAGLQVGWEVVYRDAKDRLQVGRIIEIPDPSGDGRVTLDSGVALPIAQITAVKAVDHAGNAVAAWTVNPHGYDGTKSANPPMLTGPDRWLKRFRRLADLTSGITREDPRFARIMQLLDRCEEAYVRGDDEAFIHHARQVAGLINVPLSRQGSSAESGSPVPSPRAAQRPLPSSDPSTT